MEVTVYEAAKHKPWWGYVRARAQGAYAASDANALRIDLSPESIDKLFRLRDLYETYEQAAESVGYGAHDVRVRLTTVEFGQVNDESEDQEVEERLDQDETVWGLPVRDPHTKFTNANGDLVEPDVEFVTVATGYVYAAADEYGLSVYAYDVETDDRLECDFSWVGLEQIVADNPYLHPVSEAARALAIGILADEAWDRLPILADALEEASSYAPTWLLAVLRSDNAPTWLLGSPVGRSIAGELPWGLPDEEDESDGSNGDTRDYGTGRVGDQGDDEAATAG